MVCCWQTTAAVPVDAARLAKSMSKGKGAGASFDPGTRILDEKLAKAKAQQAAREQEWKEKVGVCVFSCMCLSACVCANRKSTNESVS
jgi:hypothetical protein